jgi:hypothetical protein
MSGFQLTSGQRTVEHSVTCPTCAIRRSVQPDRYGHDFLLPEELCDSLRCAKTYIEKIQKAMMMFLSAEKAFRLWGMSWHGVLPVSVSRLMDEQATQRKACTEEPPHAP